MTIGYGSVCSGIEAASTAWEQTGWRPHWFSEIEPFPSEKIIPRVFSKNNITQIRQLMNAAGKGEQQKIKGIELNILILIVKELNFQLTHTY